MKKQIYAVYRGKELQFHGTKQEIAEITLWSMRTIHSYASPGYLKKNENTDAVRLIKIPGAFR